MSSTRTSEPARFLATLFADAPCDSFIEVRIRERFGMHCEYLPSDDIAHVDATVARYSRRTDVYVGVVPRLRRRGTRADLVPSAAVIWADCDSHASVEALATFAPAPSIVVASGTDEHRHAYWLLNAPDGLDFIEAANRRLAYLLRADQRCADAARILRPPSLNHKHDPPRRVRLLACDAGRRHRLDDIVGIVDDSAVSAVARRSDSSSERRDNDDPLLHIDSAHYVERLAGVVVTRGRKARCPFHDDATPSLHVYRDPASGWYCYGCERGGSIYDFAALLWHRDTRGPDFVELRAQLRAALDIP